jgi:TonB family protein
MAWSASIAMHLVLASIGATIAAADAEDPPAAFRHHVTRTPAPTTFAVELPTLTADEVARWTGKGDVDHEPEMGGERMPRPDTGRSGRGGDATAAMAAINLAPRDDEVHLTPLLRSRLDRAQHARHREGDERRSPEDDSAADHPMIATIFVMGTGTRLEQRPFAPHDPGAGSFVAGVPRTFGGPFARRLPPGFGLAPRTGSPKVGDASYDAVGAGVLDSWWQGSGYAAQVANARPYSLKGRTSSMANRRGEHEDTVDAEQEDVTMDRSLFHASTAGGPHGVGRGGERGRGATGSGGVTGPGSRSYAMGTGSGKGNAVDPRDRRRRLYLRRVAAKIHGSWSASYFPKKAVMEGKNGETRIAMTIHANGSISGVRVVRRSGFPSFDAKVLAALLRAAPFGPMPADLGGALRYTHPFVVRNPAVR